ncbi:hypothetical protein AB751O23_AC_00370 [Chlamydiales bacterium SCGC AB-751-O23]|jgi:hypothetical protein|nr:hypothetical protein AB751O23_AC_00370 [Chlamydiales bacterium SCGC AB-751-O23]
MSNQTFNTSLSINLETLSSKNSPDVLTLKIANRFIHSQYDPLKSAEQQAADISKKLVEKKITHLILIGQGLGYLSDALAMGPFNLIIYEPFNEIFERGLSQRPPNSFTDFKSLFSHLEELQDNSWKPYVLTHPGYDSFTRFDLHFITKYIKRTFFPPSKDEWLFLPIQRNLDNLPHLIENPGLENLENKFKGETAIIVGAGPSLKSAIPALKKRKGGVLLSAIQAAPLLSEHNIEIDFITVADPADFSVFFSKVKKSFKGLFLEASCHPLSFNQFKDKTYVYNIKGDCFHQRLWDFSKKFEITFPLATVSEVQTVIAHSMGIEKFIHIGCDYSWGQDRYSYRPKGFDNAIIPPNRAPFDVLNVHNEIVHTNAGYYHGYRCMNYFFQQDMLKKATHLLFGEGLNFFQANHLDSESLEKLLFSLAPCSQVPKNERNKKKETYNFTCDLLEEVQRIPLKDRNEIHQTLDDHGSLSILPAKEFLSLAKDSFQQLKKMR